MTNGHSYFVLLEEFKAPGCPVCGLFIKDSQSYLDSLLYENVLDVPTRLNLMDSFGFCNWHAWQIPQLPAICAPAVGLTIFASDLLRKFNLLVGTMNQAPRKKNIWLLFRSGPRKLFPQLKVRVCPACSHVTEFEAFHLKDLLDALDEKEFVEAYNASEGICLPHLFLVEQKHSKHPNFPLLLKLQLAKSQSLRETLEEFIRKQDRRFQDEITAEEARAWRVALEFLNGKRGVFNNEMRTNSLWDGRADGPPANGIFAGALGFARVSIGDLIAKAKIARQVTVCQKEPLPKLLLKALSDLVTAQAHPTVEIVVEDVSDASYLSKLHSAGFELFYGLGLPRQTLIFLNSERGFILEDNTNIQAFKSLSAREVENLYYKLLWSRFGHAVSLRGSVKSTDAAENLFCLALERERKVWCRLRGDGPDPLPGVGQSVAVLAWEKWFSHIFDVIQLEFLSGEKSCSGDVG